MKVFFLDLDGLNRYWEPDNDEYFIIALLGQIKVEKHDLAHILPCSNVTGTKIPIRKIVHRLMTMKEEIFLEHLELFPVDIRKKIKDNDNDVKLVIKSHYSCFKTFRRSSDTRALEVRTKLLKDDIDIVNHWRITENAKGKRASNSMLQHYAEVEVLLEHEPNVLTDQSYLQV